MNISQANITLRVLELSRHGYSAGDKRAVRRMIEWCGENDERFLLDIYRNLLDVVRERARHETKAP